MSRHVTMVLVNTFHILDVFDLTEENYPKAVAELIDGFKDEFCERVASKIDDPSESELQEAVIGYVEPERLIAQVKKHHRKNIAEALKKLKTADVLLMEQNTSVSSLLMAGNFNALTKPEYIDGLWNAADALTLLCGREHIDMYFYDLTDSSSRISEAQMQSIKGTPGEYSLIPIAFRCKKYKEANYE